MNDTKGGLYLDLKKQKKKTVSVIYILFIKCFLHNRLERLSLLFVLGCKNNNNNNRKFVSITKEKKQHNIQIQGVNITNQQIEK